MKKILIYAGTTEGRSLAKQLEQAGIRCDVCVATEYGEQVMEQSEHIHVMMGRLSTEEMKQLYKENTYLAVVDATHPFATAVTENIQESLKDCDIPYLRLSRDTEGALEDGCIFVESVEECARLLADTEGQILLTTGSKELATFCEIDGLKDRLIVRVLPGMESLKLCYDQGLEGKQIIAMQGPFTEEMNLAQMHQYGISVLVTKESGKTGGVDTKLAAARKAGVTCYVIRKPEMERTGGSSLNEVCDALSKICDVNIACVHEIEVVLAGVGMGTKNTMTYEVRQQIEQSDYIFGAPRMLEQVGGSAKQYPYYLAKDILPCLEQIHSQATKQVRVTILFSGDTGFFSGCEKMYQALLSVPYVNASIMPGISSIVELSARTGIAWQDATIISAHGVENAVWEAQLQEAICYNKKLFFLTSGPQDLKVISNIIWEDGRGTENGRTMYVGYQLSYQEERVWTPSYEECQQLEQPGLYVGMIVQEQVKMRPLTPALKDDDFIRDKVPMTKEEVRHISVCKLGLTEESIVYDVGSGTGSIAVEMARLSHMIKVYAIETNPVAVELIERNKSKHGCENLQVVEGMAPNVMEQLPAPTHAFIGGSKGNLKEILDALYQKNSGMRIVMNAVSMESICEMQQILKTYSVTDVEITQLSVSKAKELGDYHLMQANNPVFIFSFVFTDGSC